MSHSPQAIVVRSPGVEAEPGNGGVFAGTWYRRRFLTALSTAWLSTAFGWPATGAAGKAQATPLWRGFNLTEKALASRNLPFSEEDFDIIADLGFNFVRLPLDYKCWTDNDGHIREKTLTEIDNAIDYGRQRKLHVNLALATAPGYCHCTTEAEPIWRDEGALNDFDAQWRMFAERYRGIAPDSLSFNLIGEPHGVSPKAYSVVARSAIDAIRSLDAQRPLVADGVGWATTPVPELATSRVIESLHVYDPHQVTHFGAAWLEGSDRWSKPSWPMTIDGVVWDRAKLKKDRIDPWKALESQGVAIHVGEFGVFNKTPQSVTLAWMQDVLSLFKEAHWGWALWQLRGPFGVIDSSRSDVTYENYRGHKLHRRMLDMLLAG